jgi:hypothetical protein
MTTHETRSVLVGLEDSAPSGVAATAAAQVALDRDATTVTLLYVIDTYTAADGLLGMSGVTIPSLFIAAGVALLAAVAGLLPRQRPSEPA